MKLFLCFCNFVEKLVTVISRRMPESTLIRWHAYELLNWYLINYIAFSLRQANRETIICTSMCTCCNLSVSSQLVTAITWDARQVLSPHQEKNSELTSWISDWYMKFFTETHRGLPYMHSLSQPAAQAHKTNIKFVWKDINEIRCRHQYILRREHIEFAPTSKPWWNELTLLIDEV